MSKTGYRGPFRDGFDTPNNIFSDYCDETSSLHLPHISSLTDSRVFAPGPTALDLVDFGCNLSGVNPTASEDSGDGVRRALTSTAEESPVEVPSPPVEQQTPECAIVPSTAKPRRLSRGYDFRRQNNVSPSVVFNQPARPRSSSGVNGGLSNVTRPARLVGVGEAHLISKYPGEKGNGAVVRLVNGTVGDFTNMDFLVSLAFDF